MLTYPFDDKLRSAIDAMGNEAAENIWFEGRAGADLTWSWILDVEAGKKNWRLAKLTELGFAEKKVRKQMSALKTESVKNLVELARQDRFDDPLRSSPALIVLSLCHNQKAFEIGKKLVRSKLAAERIIGIKTLAREHSEEFLPKSAPILLKCLENESDDHVLEVLAFATMHLNIEGRWKFLKPHADNPSEAVRLAIASSLGGEEDRDSISTLIKLTRDPCDDIRNWATFSLGILCKQNTERVRAALFARVNDEHDELRHEAILGLAVRKDHRVWDIITDELLSGPRIWGRTLEAVVELADVSFYPMLQDLKVRWQTKDPEDIILNNLDSALEACRP
ncbi:MAG: hypothetical protein SGJ27_23775 [Candidatus Melainabacteria bacterium]|nr:hypothetical protein [Candidatus Melainabacteria bacterium]